jgi:chitinase
MVPEDIPIGAFSHLNAAFLYIDPNSFLVTPMETNHIDLYSRVTGLKQYDPLLKTWISIGGWSFNDAPTQNVFSNLAASSSAQSAFFSSLISFLSQYGFDGVDIDWCVGSTLCST